MFYTINTPDGDQARLFLLKTRLHIGLQAPFIDKEYKLLQFPYFINDEVMEKAFNSGDRLETFRTIIYMSRSFDHNTDIMLVSTGSLEDQIRNMQESGFKRFMINEMPIKQSCRTSIDRFVEVLKKE